MNEICCAEDAASLVADGYRRLLPVRDRLLDALAQAVRPVTRLHRYRDARTRLWRAAVDVRDCGGAAADRRNTHE